MSTGQVLLHLDEVTMRFGGVTALDGVDLTVRNGEIAGLIGPNGAGKTTIFNVVTGVFEPTAGRVLFDGEDLLTEPTPVWGTGLSGVARALSGVPVLRAVAPAQRRRKPHKVTKRGIARTFQNIRLFADMTAVQNVMVGADNHHSTSVPGALVRAPRHRREEREGRARAMELLALVGVEHRADDLARNLPYGDQRRLEIARALATEPKLVLLDEPAAGFNPNEKRALSDLIRKVRDSGYTVLLIEHDMGLVMPLCDRIMVLDFGKKIADGLPAEVQADEKVINAYLGVPT